MARSRASPEADLPTHQQLQGLLQGSSRSLALATRRATPESGPALRHGLARGGWKDSREPEPACPPVPPSQAGHPLSSCRDVHATICVSKHSGRPACPAVPLRTSVRQGNCPMPCTASFGRSQKSCRSRFAGRKGDFSVGLGRRLISAVSAGRGGGSGQSSAALSHARAGEQFLKPQLGLCCRCRHPAGDLVGLVGVPIA